MFVLLGPAISAVGMQSSSEKRTAPGATFDKSNRPDLVENDTPGPYTYGSYNKPTAPSIGFGKGERNPGTAHERSPGPGYTIDRGFDGPSATFGTSLRPALGNGGEGADTYVDLASPAGPSATFGTSSRSKGPADSGGPGVGAYYTDSGPSGPEFTIGERWATNSREEQGPGAKPLTGAVGMQEDSTRPTAPAYGFGSGNRSSLRNTANPGPGKLTISKNENS